MNITDDEDISYKITFILILIFLIYLIIGASSSIASSCVINEVMVNPIESDNSNEWIELYNPTNKTINLSGWKLSDNYATDELLPANTSIQPLFPSQTFVLITDQDTTLTIPVDENDSVIHFMVDDNSIGNGLGNTDDFLKLIDENNTIIDTIEWGINTSEIPGEPIDTPAEGNSLIRINHIQTNNSAIDFAETTIPTPGKPNIFSKTGSIHIDKYQKYIPKINKYETFSPPFAIHVHLTNFTPNTSYQLKSFITGNQSTYPASQTWTGEKWQYSDRYTHTITTDESGFWQDWMYLRFSKNYNAYNENIQHYKSCLLNLKVKDNQTIEHIQKTVTLLDMDNSTSNGEPGGYYIDVTTQNQRLFLTNETHDLFSFYISEPNNIDDFSPVIHGYCKLTAPVHSNLTLSTINDTGVINPLKTNISISPGIYHFDTKTKESSFNRKNRKEFSTTLTINNTGSLSDTYHLSISDESSGFHAHLQKTKISLKPNEEQQITVFIDPLSHRLFELQYGSITVTITSERDPILQKTHTFSCQLHEPDLTIPKIKTYNSEGTETQSCLQGRIFRIKAFLKNNGDETARDVTVSYFLDAVKKENLLGTKTYETVKQYQKYPSLYLDTLHITPGEHTIFVVADYENTVKELDEYNNENSIQLTIVNTTPSKESQQLLITEFYYYAHPTIHNEFITLFNPTNTTISLDNWYITNTVSQRCDDQKKIVFPRNINILPNSSITITQNSSAYYQERMLVPDFEYETNANQSIPQLNTTNTIFFSNKGGSIALKNEFNHTIDSIIYGNTTTKHSFWNGSSIPSVNQGEILKRNKQNETFLDTNSA
ncbi:MAG: lamin tail domain-containing protein, partial [Candidatus Thermoplasmatota archaeon]|nr:lamin tail domain-containing protein [Candidatus Thermoplasmatota archaeon]